MSQPPRVLPISGVRAKPCEDCPSMQTPHDPETVDILETWPRDLAIRTIFTCAWTAGKLCCGYVRLLEVTPEEIAEVQRERDAEPSQLATIPRKDRQ